MKLNLGDYKIESDSNCFVLSAKKIVQPIVKNGKTINKDTVGNERWVAVGYFSQVDKLLEAIPRQILLDNDDLKEISKKLGVLSIKIGGIKMTLEGVIKHE